MLARTRVDQTQAWAFLLGLRALQTGLSPRLQDRFAKLRVQAGMISEVLASSEILL